LTNEAARASICKLSARDSDETRIQKKFEKQRKKCLTNLRGCAKLHQASAERAKDFQKDLKNLKKVLDKRELLC